jgi:response regulator RpfG family c-di-GMP phosphodiesterase
MMALPETSDAGTAGERGAARPGEPKAPHVVLVASDDLPSCRSLAAAFEGTPEFAVELSRAGDASDEAIRTCPTVIVLELRDDGGESLRALEVLTRSPETEAVPVIALARSSDAASRDRAFASGASDVAPLPIESPELRARARIHSSAYLSLVRRNTAVAALQRVQAELRHAQRELAELRRRDSAPDGHGGAGWRTRMSGLLQVGIELNQIHDFHTLMERILSEARHLLGTDAGTIFLREGEYLRFAYFQNESLARRSTTGETPRVSSFRLPINDRSIAGWVALSGQSLRIDDCYAMDPSLPFRFDPSFDQLLGYRTQSMLGVALKNRSGRVLGVIELINPVGTEDVPRDGFGQHDTALLEHFASIATVALERAHLTESVILRMIRMAEVRDPSETGPHVERVAGYATVLFEEWARRRGLDGASFERQRDRLRIAAKLHDVGKIGVPDAILRKPERLTPEEFEQVKLHAEIGAALFEDQPTDFDEAAREVALHHHERWDGTGYPGLLEGLARRGRRGEEIPLFARIVGLADVFDALSSHRAYKRAWTEAQVLDAIRAEANRAFDPELVDILLRRLPEIRSIRDAHRDHDSAESSDAGA